jgi:hypothetical protein
METPEKIVYFVVAVDLSTGTKYIDDETLTARFPKSDESYEEYTQALAILNNPEWGKQ